LKPVAESEPIAESESEASNRLLKKSVSESELISESKSESSSYLSGENFDSLIIHRGLLDFDD